MDRACGKMAKNLFLKLLYRQDINRMTEDAKDVQKRKIKRNVLANLCNWYVPKSCLFRDTVNNINQYRIYYKFILINNFNWVTGTCLYVYMYFHISLIIINEPEINV